MLYLLNVHLLCYVLVKAQEPATNTTFNDQLPTTTNIDILNLNKWFDGHMKCKYLT